MKPLPSATCAGLVGADEVPATTLPVVPVPLISTPLDVLPEMTSLEPMVLSVAPPAM